MAYIMYILSYVVQLLLLYCLIFFLSKAIFRRSTTYLWQQLHKLKRLSDPPLFLLKLLFIHPSKLNATHQLLFSQLSLNVSYLTYLLFYRILIMTTSSVTILLVILTSQSMLNNGQGYIIISLLLLLALVCEKFWLKLITNFRKKRIVFDLYQLSYHLLYFADSQMNIYSKLQRCLPYTSAIKQDLQLLLLSWTQNSDAALQQFKIRLGCKEAISFVDTIQALKQHQDETFYTLLRERIEEYKEQLNIANDSKKETSSYILFILAGIPILYTFQVFIYPWVKEVQKLLLQLN